MSSSNCCFLTCIQISQEAGKVVWYSHLFQNFPQFIVIHTKALACIVNEAEVDVFLEFSCLFYDPTDVDNLILVPLPFLNPTWTSGSSQFTSVTQSCPTLWDFMDCSTPGFPVHHQLLEIAQTHVCWVGDAIQPSHPLSSPSPPAFNLSQHQGLFKWVSSWHQVAKVLEFQLQHQSFQWVFRTDFL